MDYVTDTEYNKYLNTLHYQDNFLRNLIDQYKELGLYENTVFVVLGDHGEAFREHGFWGHGSILYEEVARIPLLVIDPTLAANKRDERVSVVDILPSVMAYQGYEIESPFYPGVSFLNDIPARDIFLECVTPQYCSAIIDGESGYKLIHNYDRRADSLFDLRNDPDERNDLISSENHQRLVRSLLLKLKRWVKQVAGNGEVLDYESWGFHRQGQTSVEILPEADENDERVVSGDQVRLIKGNKFEKVLALVTSKPELIAGDSLRLAFYLRSPSTAFCLRSRWKGATRNVIRHHYIEPGDSPYIRIMGSVQLMEEAEQLSVIWESLELDKNALS